MTIRERWLVDGYDLTEGSVRDVEYRSGQLGTPGMRGSNARVANRTGEQYRPKVHDAGGFTLELWFGEDQAEAQRQWDEILRAVVSPHRLTTYERVTAAGEVRSCGGEITGKMEPTAIGQAAYRASLEVGVPRGYWLGEQVHTVSTPLIPAGATGPAAVIDVDLTPFASATAPLEDLQLELTGGLKRPRVLDVTPLGRGEELRYELEIPAGRSLRADCGAWELTGTGGLVPDEAALNYGGDRYFTVGATKPGQVAQLRLSADEIGPTGRLTVTGRRSYLC